MAMPDRGVLLEAVVLVVPGVSRSEPVDLEVQGNRITTIRASHAGKVTAYVLPGLADAHMHGPPLPFPGENALYTFLYLYHGVTAARMAAGDDVMRDAIEAQDYPGPQLTSCGPFIDGDPPRWRNSLVVIDSASAVQAVNNIAAQGYDCIKVYDELTPQSSEQVYVAAAAAGLPVIGHVPWRQDATSAWIDDQQHLLGLPPIAPELTKGEQIRAMLRLDEVDAVRQAQLARSMLASGSTLTPTLITLQRKIALQDFTALQQTAAAQMLPRYYRKQLWHGQKGLVSSRLFSAVDHDQFRAVYPHAEAAIAALYQAGVELHTGTDSPAEFIVPGSGLLEELHLLNAAGLDPETVLNLSAVKTARYILGPEYGRLDPDAPANFVVYANDPTLDLAYLDTRMAVVRDGRYYSQAQLEEQLNLYRAWFENPLYRSLSEAIVGFGLWLINAIAPG